MCFFVGLKGVRSFVFWFWVVRCFWLLVGFFIRLFVTLLRVFLVGFFKSFFFRRCFVCFFRCSKGREIVCVLVLGRSAFLVACLVGFFIGFFFDFASCVFGRFLQKLPFSTLFRVFLSLF